MKNPNSLLDELFEIRDLIKDMGNRFEGVNRINDRFFEQQDKALLRDLKSLNKKLKKANQTLSACGVLHEKGQRPFWDSEA